MATAANAVQIGTGTNDTPNSLSFMGTPIVTNGALAVPPIDPEPIVGKLEEEVETDPDEDEF